jgi:hypothetical protein
MGLFSRSTIEKELEKTYVPLYQSMGMSYGEAKNQFSEFIEQSKADSEREGTNSLPLNFGDVLLNKESTDNNVRNLLKRLREEGVTDKDIRWWWNMHELERRMMKCDDDWTRQTMFFHYMNVDKLSPEEAAKRLNKKSPLYGVPDVNKTSVGADDPLPFELKDRINIYMTDRAQTDFQDFLSEISEYSSINSFLRVKLKEGEI